MMNKIEVLIHSMTPNPLYPYKKWKMTQNHNDDVLSKVYSLLSFLATFAHSLFAIPILVLTWILHLYGECQYVYIIF